MNIKKHICVCVACVALASCNNHPSFNSPQEAVEGCHNILEEMRSTKDVDVKQLTELTSKWLETQDSSYSVFAKDSSITLRSPVAYAFFSISDSVRQEIGRLAFSQPRSLRDVMYLKLNASPERSKIISSDTYKEAVNFFDKLDDYDTYTDLQSTLVAYTALLRTTKTITREKQLIDFIIKEDKCFRSLMNYLDQVPAKDMQILTKATSSIFDKLYSAVGTTADDVNDRTMLYLTLRFNRRVIQNAIACRNNVVNNARLNDVQKATYRWMLIQPFMAIDDYSTAALTEDQHKLLLKLCDELPVLLSKLDYNKKDKDYINHLTKYLSSYFLKTYLSTTL